MDCDETSIVVYQDESPHWTVTINLTSPAVRQLADDGSLHDRRSLLLVVQGLCAMSARPSDSTLMTVVYMTVTLYGRPV